MLPGTLQTEQPSSSTVSAKDTATKHLDITLYQPTGPVLNWTGPFFCAERLSTRCVWKHDHNNQGFSFKGQLAGIVYKTNPFLNCDTRQNKTDILSQKGADASERKAGRNDTLSPLSALSFALPTTPGSPGGKAFPQRAWRQEGKAHQSQMPTEPLSRFSSVSILVAGPETNG